MYNVNTIQNMLKKSIFYYFSFCLQFIYAQSNSISHGDYKAQLSLQKNYHSAQVVNCKVFSLENETDSAQLIRLEEYDIDGKITRKLEFGYSTYQEGIDTLFTTYTYDEKGRLSSYRISGNNVDEVMCGYQYNDKNELTYYGVAAAEAREFSLTYKKGLLMHEIGNGATQLKEDGTPNWVKFEETFFEYNKNKQRIGETYYFLGNLQTSKEYQYDEKGNLATEKLWQGEKTGEPYAVLIYTYNEKNLLISVKNVTEETGESYLYMLAD